MPTLQHTDGLQTIRHSYRARQKLVLPTIKAHLVQIWPAVARDAEDDPPPPPAIATATTSVPPPPPSGHFHD
ncbi:hypothetical protein RB195_000959 [Necator americanus]|uniref:Uncharacterized protein n=1 Tax=Necator americanus TaxID=51031 RepID=A0ABR1DC32_NECAM